MNRKLAIAAALVAIGALVILVLADGRIPFYGVGLAVEILYFLSTAYLLWTVRAQALTRIGAIVASAILVAVIGAYLSSAAFGKIDFSLRLVALDFALHVLATVAFLGLVWLLDRAIPGTRGPQDVNPA